jgi:hypothetical protein
MGECVPILLLNRLPLRTEVLPLSGPGWPGGGWGMEVKSPPVGVILFEGFIAGASFCVQERNRFYIFFRQNAGDGFTKIERDGKQPRYFLFANRVGRNEGPKNLSPTTPNRQQFHKFSSQISYLIGRKKTNSCCDQSIG